MRTALPFLLVTAFACGAPRTAPSPKAAAMDEGFKATLSIDPTSVELAPSATMTFRPALNYPKGKNYLRPPVKWSVQEGGTGGVIDAMGHYAAPAVAGTYHVIVERTDAAGLRAIATVTVR